MSTCTAITDPPSAKEYRQASQRPAIVWSGSPSQPRRDRCLVGMTTTNADRRTEVVVLGGGYAGVTAALRLAPHCRVTLVEAREHFVERIRLHQLAAGGRASVSHPYAELLAGSGVRHLAGRAVSLDPASSDVEVEVDGGERLTLGYDRLVYALGSRTAVPAHVLAESSSAGSGSAGSGSAGSSSAGSAQGDPEASRCYTAETASELARVLADRRGRLAVVGGGLTGIEMASELAESHPGWEIRLLTAGSLAPTLSARGRAHIRVVLERLGVRVEEGTAVSAPDEIDADAVLWSASMMPNTGLAAAAGLELDDRGRIRVDAALRSASHPGIVVAGDAGSGWRMACATAMPTGVHAAGTVLREVRGEAARPFRLRYVTACLSLGRSDALLQPLHTDDRPRGRVLTGRPAVWAKEAIVAGTIGTLRVAARRPSVLRMFAM